jgi:hypothetical protein
MRRLRSIVLIAWLTLPATLAAGPGHTALAAQLVRKLNPLMSEEFGLNMSGAIASENKVTVLQTVVVDYALPPGRRNSSWGEKVVRVLEKAGAENARITARVGREPAEVRAANLPVGDRVASVVRVAVSDPESRVEFVVAFMSRPPGPRERPQGN